MGKLISTKQAADILKVSISTVSRYFDQGLLKGSKHPLTNWRKIDMDSIENFLQEFAPNLIPTPVIEKPKQEEEKPPTVTEVKTIDEKSEPQ